jgi:alpha-glucosidase
VRELALRPHHDESPLHVSAERPQLGDTVRVRLRVPEALGRLEDVYLRANPDREPRFSRARFLGTIEEWCWWEADLHVDNRSLGYRWLLRPEGRPPFWLTAAGVSSIETRDFDDFRVTTESDAPAWASRGVLYQVFPDRFARSTAAGARVLPEWAQPAAWSDEPIHTGPSTPFQFYGGDLDGVAARLDHLERLGINILYLTPFFPARSNHRYDALSFDTVDPLLGGDEALIRLVAAARARGIKVMGDLTTNHCGDAHEWFRAAYGNPGAPESEFFYWLNEQQTEYESWLGVPSLPKLNWGSSELRRRFIDGPDSVVGKWLRAPFSLDGWRIDVANMTGRYRDDDLNEEVRTTIRRTMRAINPDTLLVAEITNDAATDLPGGGWHGAMTYANLTRPLWGWLTEQTAGCWYFGMPRGPIPRYTGEQVHQAHVQFVAGLPWSVRKHNLNALDTHDTPRFLTSAVDGALEVGLGLCVTLPGIPMVWAGDEFGLVGVDGEHSRTAIPWDGADAAEVYISMYREFISLRTSHPVLGDGGVRWLDASADSLVFVRESADEVLLVMAARAAATARLPGWALAGEPVRVRGTAAARLTPHGWELDAAGISLTVWALPGVRTPGDDSDASAGPRQHGSA